MPGGTTYEPITLEQGLTHDLNFQRWANLVNNREGDGAMSLKDFRKDIVIHVLNLQGQIAMAFNVYRCWPSEFTAVPDLDAATMNAIAIQTMVLQTEGWERDASVTEPAET